MTGANRDLHSGHFGGAVANPINVLCKLIADVIDENGRITIPHFYDDVEEVPAAEREMIAAIPFDEEAYKQGLGVEALQGEKGAAPVVRKWAEQGRGLAVPVHDEGVVTDIDTVDALARAEALWRQRQTAG